MHMAIKFFSGKDRANFFSGKKRANYFLGKKCAKFFSCQLFSCRMFCIVNRCTFAYCIGCCIRQEIFIFSNRPGRRRGCDTWLACLNRSYRHL